MDGFGTDGSDSARAGRLWEAKMETRGKVLVIDDEEGIRRGIQRVLTHEGYVVGTAADGQAGLEALARDTYDLLLVDLKMPGLVDGLGVIKEALARDPDVIAVVISAYATLEAAVQATRMGAYDFLAKPFTPEELKITVQKGLERRFLILERKKLVEERERSLLELSKERSRLKSVVNSMADGVLVINPHGLVVYANPTVRELLRLARDPEGLDYREGLGKSPIDPQLEKMMAEDDPARISHEFDLDEKTTVMANITRVQADDDSRLGYVMVLRDISRLKELDRTKSRFVSVVSHELKAPLAAIEGYLDVILAGTVGEMPEKPRSMLERCRDRAASLQNLIKDILNITRIEAQTITRHIQRQPVPQIAEGVLELLKSNADQRAIALVHEAPAKLPDILADREDLERILTNLISNAIKYNRDRGTVTVRYRVEDGYLAISVADTGIGIEKEHQDYLGREFFRVRNAETSRITGTGLGLSIVKKLMEFYHGRLSVQSTPGEGTVFTVSFPLDGKEAVPPRPGEPLPR